MSSDEGDKQADAQRFLSGLSADMPRKGRQIVKTVAGVAELQRHLKMEPHLALAELVWNALDADADNVEILFRSNVPGARELRWDEIWVRDDGDGIPFPLDHPDLHPFCPYGHSQKHRASNRTPRGRVYQGRHGMGRFRALSLGGEIVWRTVFKNSEEDFYSYECSLCRNSNDLELSRPVKLTGVSLKTGTEVVISSLIGKAEIVETDEIYERLSRIFAPYLSHVGSTVIIDGQRLDPATFIKRREKVASGGSDVDGSSWQLEVIEWNSEKTKRPKNLHMIVYDEDESYVDELELSMKEAPLFSFHVAAAMAREWEAQAFSSLAPGLHEFLEATKRAISDFLKQSERQAAREFQNSMRDEGVFPFDGSAKNPIEYAEREIFTEVAFAVSRNVGSYDSLNKKSKRLVLSLLKRILEQNPERVVPLLESVLDLPEDDKQSLERLLEQTELSKIIKLSSLVSDRITYLDGLDRLVHKFKRETDEVHHLHQYLARAGGLWVFSEEYSIAISERGFTEVLKTVLEKEVGNEVDVDPVKNVATGGVSRLDLFFSAHVSGHTPSTKKSLVVELKRPSLLIGINEVQQAERYLLTLESISQFKDGRTWDVWLIGQDIKANFWDGRDADERRTSIVKKSANGTVRVKTWAQILDEARSRMKFLQDQVAVEINEDHVIELFERYPEFVPPQALGKVGT